jgi:uroporphyrin-III C-methyltransferase
MSNGLKSGVLVVGHGSRRREANEDVREAARRIAERGSFPIVETAFLEIEHPNISEGFARLVQRGAREIVVHPYFLSPGRHTRGDIPVEVAEAARQHPGVSYRISKPLSAHSLVIQASVERIREKIGERLETQISGEAHNNKRRRSDYRAERGTVYLVGAGPGDPGLLTVKARDLLESCDVIVYDYLVNPDLLQIVPESVERIYVGKVGGGRQTPQDQINSLLIDHARRRSRVVRLKGGDPFLFGRGAEEAQALRSAGIPYEVVPGISSALAVPAYAGIPLTHRDLSSSVVVLTGARAGDGGLTRSLTAHASTDTIVILMGVAHLREIAVDLIAAGRSAETPVAVIRWGTYEAQQTVTGTLRTIADRAESSGMRAPAVIVVGEVVALRERLQWFENSFSGKSFDDLNLALTAAG